MSILSKFPMFLKENYDILKIRMPAHLATLDDDMWYVITDGPMQIMKVEEGTTLTDGAPNMTEKPRHEWTTGDKRKANLDYVARDILYQTLDTNAFSRIRSCTTAKKSGKC